MQRLLQDLEERPADRELLAAIARDLGRLIAQSDAATLGASWAALDRSARRVASEEPEGAVAAVLSTLAETAGAAVHAQRASAAATAEREALAPVKERVWFLLADEGPLRPSMVADRLALARPHVTRALRSLENECRIRRLEPEPGQDRRSCRYEAVATQPRLIQGRLAPSISEETMRLTLRLLRSATREPNDKVLSIE